jgi:uncharacterized protein (TIGR03382 family)
MKLRRPHSLVFALSAAVSLFPCSYTRAELVRAQLQGIVNSSPIPALNGQLWALALVFDTAAPESPFSAGSPNFAAFFNTGPVKVLRTLDFSVGNSGAFTIHLVDPVPNNEADVRIDIDNFTSKTFFTHIDDPALLPAWNGLQLDNFLLGLEDPIPGGYADGTDHLPGPDPAITIGEFTSFAQVRLQIGPSGQLTGTPSSFALTSVPEVSPGSLCAVGGLAVLLLQRRRRLREGSIGPA